MDVVDQANRVTEAWLDGALSRVRRDAECLRHGALLGPLLCLDCCDAIPRERLAALPGAERCVHCQERREADRRVGGQ